MQYYLRLEGVNLNNFVYDTNDLSAVRGGSLLLLEAVSTIQRQVNMAQLEPISTGASSGLFQCEVSEHDEAENLRQHVERLLHSDSRLKHATFVVDVAPAGTDFVHDREALLARNRWRQMQQPTLAVPAHNRGHRKPPVCEIDRVRPAVDTMPGPAGTQKAVSVSIKARMDWGRKQKQQFYENETQTTISREFTRNFDELTHDPQRGNLHHKMAVIYLDGNRFGALRDDKCTSAELANAFDSTLRHYQRDVLTGLIDTVQSDPLWISRDQRYRLETLLWGGDEIIWVVPAWRGWQTLALFYRESQDWGFAGESLTHAAGMVFCHHNAPIYRIRALAKELAELSKVRNRREGQNTNRFVYQVLESFDHIGRDLETFLQERYGASERLMLSGKVMGKIEAAMRRVKVGFPRNKLHWIVRHFLSEPDVANYTLLQTVERLDSQAREAWETLQQCFDDDQALCFNVAELWDYVGL